MTRIIVVKNYVRHWADVRDSTSDKIIRKVLNDERLTGRQCFLDICWAQYKICLSRRRCS